MARSRNPARRRLSMVLNREIPIVLVLGVVAWLGPPRVAVVAGWAMVAVLVATPIARVAWLSARWMRFDRTFAWIGWGLLAAILTAAAIAVGLR